MGGADCSRLGLRAVAAWLTLAVLLLSLRAAADTPFEPPRALWGPDFQDIAGFEQADVDGDGDLDLVAAASPDGVAWWANDGDGSSFVRHDLPLTGSAAFRVRPADLDGDGDLDLAVLAWSGLVGDPRHLEWLENDAPTGDGSSWTSHVVPSMVEASSTLEVADLNGDGDADLVVATEYGGIAWWRNDGAAASWTEVQAVAAGFGGSDDLAVGDLDGDGDPDLVGGLPAVLRWWENDAGDASSWTEHTSPDPVGQSLRSVDLVDLDGDGDQDVVGATFTALWSPWIKWTTYSGEVRWWENDDPTGDASSLTLHTLEDRNHGLYSAVADVDGDGDPDLLAMGQVSGWLENDSGAFTYHVFDAPTAALPVAVGDMDGDGDPDPVLVAHPWDTLRWLANDALAATPTWTSQEVLERFHGATWASAGDLDGDGDLDVAGLAADQEELRWLEAIAPGAQLFAPRQLGQGDDVDRPALLTDLDDDGDPDLVFAASRLEAWRNDLPDGGGWVRYQPAAAGTYHPAAADLDGDGHLDLLAAGLETRWFENPGSPWSDDWPAHLLDPLTSTTAALPADIDGDGAADIVTVDLDGVIAWWPGDGAGGFDDPLPVTTSWGADLVLAIDLDGDGDTDLVVASIWLDGVTWFENVAGDGSAWSEQVVSQDLDGGSNSWGFGVSVAVADLDGDGDLDLAASVPGLFQLTWWEQGAGWSPHQLATGYRALGSLEAVDLDGDGDLDLLAAATDEDAVVLWENLGCDDLDGDGVAVIGLCPLPGGDCDDADPANAPGGAELCDGLDNDCDPDSWAPGGETDEDGDGHLGCADCDDTDPAIHPGADELCDGLDSDCDPDNPVGGEEDTDADGFPACADCDDADATVHPGAEELCDGLDNDCDPDTQLPGGETDEDGDGHLGCADCDDADPSSFPGAEELCDGRDNDCDPDTSVPGEDQDGDGDGSPACADCDDGDAMIAPGASETCDGVDNDCDPATEAPGGEGDADGDGYPACTDCDDADPSVHPYALELCDGIDNDCDGSQRPCLACDCDASGGPSRGGAAALLLALCWQAGLARRRGRVVSGSRPGGSRSLPPTGSRPGSPGWRRCSS